MTDEKILKQPSLEQSLKEQNGKIYNLVLHNDDYNTFDYVIASLVEVCEHEKEQAAQCALITHYKGRCEVKTDGLEQLKPKKLALINRGLSCTIEDCSI